MQTLLSRSRLQVACAAAPPAKGELRKSRIGAKPIAVPKGVDIAIDGKLVKVKVGPDASWLLSHIAEAALNLIDGCRACGHVL
jgi:hypothetical protein